MLNSLYHTLSLSMGLKVNYKEAKTLFLKLPFTCLALPHVCSWSRLVMVSLVGQPSVVIRRDSYVGVRGRGLNFFQQQCHDPG